MKSLNKEDVRDLVKIRKEDCNKGDFGYVGILGGCINYSGAIKLANLSLSSIVSGCRSCKIDSI